MNEFQGHILTSRGHKPHPVLRVVIPTLILLVSLGVSVALVKTAPKPKKRPPKERVSIVDVQVLAQGTQQIVLRTTGTVVPRQAVTVQPRVGGQVVAVSPNFIPGGRFRAGEVLLRIDPTDYRIALTNRLAGVVKAEYDLKVEVGMQEVARCEWEALQKMEGTAPLTPLDRELALREPHLRLARSNLQAAEALLAQARLDLARTEVTAPFNAIVRARHVEVGSLVSVQTPLADLVGTDAYWVRVTLPTIQSCWVTAADGAAEGSRVTITAVPGIELRGQWQGHVLRMLPDLEPAGRQAQFLVEVPNPDAGAERLPLGSYVRVAITGPEIEQVFAIPRRSLREGRQVWLMNAENRLEIRDIDVLWSDDALAVMSTGLEDGERLVVSDISAPLSGMLLTTVEEAARAASPAADGPKGGRR